MNRTGVAHRLSAPALFFHIGAAHQLDAYPIPVDFGLRQAGLEKIEAVCAIHLDSIVDDHRLTIEASHHLGHQSVDGPLNPALFGIDQDRHRSEAPRLTDRLDPPTNVGPLSLFIL